MVSCTKEELKKCKTFKADNWERKKRNSRFRNKARKSYIQAMNKKLKKHPEITVSYSKTAAKASTKPKQFLCDITGDKGRYKDPKSQLYYANARVYQFIQELSGVEVEEFLALRKAAAKLT
ncbi:hypothetical protein PCE1_002782 [Barthelona sp. PCE]